MRPVTEPTVDKAYAHTYSERANLTYPHTSSGDRSVHDRDAAARLSVEVVRRYREHTGSRFTKTGLSEASGIGRQTLDNWLEKGVMPSTGGMTALADAVGAPPSDLWLRWLGLEPPDEGLGQIAKEISALRLSLVRGAQVAIDAARGDPPEEPEDGPPSAPAASSRPGRPAAGTPPR